jgi:predicted amidophosphoribosyltransferase
MNKNNNTFNGSYNANQTNDSVEYCCYCGKKIDMTDEQKYCPYCGKAIPRTYTGSNYVIHWNLPDNTPTYPLDGIIYPYTTC